MKKANNYLHLCQYIPYIETRTLFFLTFLIVFFANQATIKAQAPSNVGIGTNAPDASAILELKSNNNNRNYRLIEKQPVPL